jgi:hypothetical protein
MKMGLKPPGVVSHACRNTSASVEGSWMQSAAGPAALSGNLEIPTLSGWLSWPSPDATIAMVGTGAVFGKAGCP